MHGGRSQNEKKKKNGTSESKNIFFWQNMPLKQLISAKKNGATPLRILRCFGF